MKAELVPLDGGPPIPITRDLTVVGRREYCDVQIDHPSLSKRHAVLVKTDGLLILRDLASTNGTKVKGQRIRWAALLPEDRIAFGSRKFRVYLGPDDMPGPSERPRSAKANGKGRTPAAFAAPSPLGTPVIAPHPVSDGTDSEDWRSVMKPRGMVAPTKAPAQFNEHELEIEDAEIVEVEDDDIVELP
jgi:pSer/pThr/pTyr-binding forkhead associated (FHA) protein